jgi:ABC-2 type transport system permease protein
MEKIKVIIVFEYVARVRRLSFLLTTVAFPALAIIPMILSVLMIWFGSGERHITILDQSGVPGLYESIKKKTEGAPAGAKYIFSQVVVAPDLNVDQFRLKFNSEIENNPGEAYLVLRQGVLDGDSPEYYAGEVSDFTLADLAGRIGAAVIDQKLAHDGIDPERYLKPLKMKTIKVSPKGEAKESGANLIASLAIFMFTFLGIFGHGSQVMWSVIEEKDTRIMETLVSSAKPFEMMMGKLIGIGLVGLTQYIIWVIFAMPVLFVGQSALTSRGITLGLIPISSSLYFIIYFALGYFLLASMYLIGGALATDSESSNIVTRFITIITSVPMLSLLTVIQNPSGALALTLSFIPFLAAPIMAVRIALSSPPLWQILLSMLLMMASTGTVIWVAAKVYRVGILLYGKKPTLREITRWLRYA